MRMNPDMNPLRGPGDGGERCLRERCREMERAPREGGPGLRPCPRTEGGPDFAGDERPCPGGPRGFHGPRGPHGMCPPPPMPNDDTLDGRMLNLLRMAGHLAMMRPGLRSGQFRVLSLLADGEPVPQKQLAERLRIQPGSLSETVGKLELAGAVTRERDETDRRAVTVTITPEGSKRLAAMRESMDIDRSELLCVLSDEEKETLTALLEKIVRSARPPFGRPPLRPHFCAEPGEDERA